MSLFRREFIKLAGAAAFSGSALAFAAPGAKAQAVRPAPNVGPEATFDVRRFGAVGDGKAIDTPAVNRAIDAAAAAGGGVVTFPAGTYACYTIRLKSHVMLYVGPGATILAASTPKEGTTSGGYDAAESNAPWEAYQDYGHNHWRNSLIWGEGLTDIAIMGPGLIWGKGLARGGATEDLPDAAKPGVGNKAISLKNCRNVILRDLSMLACGHFALLATGVDNLTIDNLTIDTNRDGLDIDCCKNVHISNCSINSPWDDAICPKSSFALGYARATENVTITGCYVTGDYKLGTMLDGTFKRFGPPVGGVSSGAPRAGRIKMGTESNGGFKNITVSGCVFESCAGFALETVDGAILEDITFTGVTMRDIVNAPFFFRLGARMRGPKDAAIGSFKRVIVSGVSCYGARADMPSLLAGLPDRPIEDIKIADLYLEQPGGGTAAMMAARPPEHREDYPESSRWGALPAASMYVRHARNLELSHVELALKQADPRPLFWLEDVAGFDSYGLKTPRGRKGPTFQLNNVRDLRALNSRDLPDLRVSVPGVRTI
jgi:polygalacturonase